MFDDDMKRREKAYRLWEEESRPEGRHEDHWRRAGEQAGLSDQESEDVTKVNQEADREAHEGGESGNSRLEVTPPSVTTPD